MIPCTVPDCPPWCRQSPGTPAHSDHPLQEEILFHLLQGPGEGSAHQTVVLVAVHTNLLTHIQQIYIYEYNIYYPLIWAQEKGPPTRLGNATIIYTVLYAVPNHGTRRRVLPPGWALLQFSIFTSLKILPYHKIIYKAQLTFFHSIHNKYAPTIFSSTWQLNSERNAAYDLRNATSYIVPPANFAFFERSPLHTLPKVWNNAGIVTLQDNLYHIQNKPNRRSAK